MTESPRRSFLKWLVRLLAAFNVSLLGIPLISFALGTLRRQETPRASLRRVVRLGEIPTERPVLIPIIGNLRDAWTLHAGEVVGRVWLIRGAIDAGDPAKTSIKALSAICPHLGCLIQMTSDSKRYVCPCHRAAYDFNGERVDELKSGKSSPAPRSMDSLKCKVVQDELSKEWWIEVMYEEFQQGLTTSVPIA